MRSDVRTDIDFSLSARLSQDEFSMRSGAHRGFTERLQAILTNKVFQHRALPHSTDSLPSRDSSSESIARISYYSRHRSVFFNFPYLASLPHLTESSAIAGKSPRRDGPAGKPPPNRVMNIPRLFPARSLLAPRFTRRSERRARVTRPVASK